MNQSKIHDFFKKSLFLACSYLKAFTAYMHAPPFSQKRVFNREILYSKNCRRPGKQKTMRLSYKLFSIGALYSRSQLIAYSGEKGVTCN